MLQRFLFVVVMQRVENHVWKGHSKLIYFDCLTDWWECWPDGVMSAGRELDQTVAQASYELLVEVSRAENQRPVTGESV